MLSTQRNCRVSWKSSWCDGVKCAHPYCGLFIKAALRALNNENSEFPPIQLSGLKVIGLSEPKRTQSLSQSSSADAHPPRSPPPTTPSSESSPIPRCQMNNREKKEIKTQMIVIYCLLCTAQWRRGGQKTEQNPLQIELPLFEPGLLQKKNTNSMTAAINDNGTIIYSDLSERLISQH